MFDKICRLLSSGFKLSIVLISPFPSSEKGDRSRAYGEDPLPAGYRGKGKQAKPNISRSL